MIGIVLPEISESDAAAQLPAALCNTCFGAQIFVVHQPSAMVGGAAVERGLDCAQTTALISPYRAGE